MTNVVILGEAWGAEEEKQRSPFVGASGYELTRMLSEAGIARADCFLTNVFNLRPSGNHIEALCGDKKSRIEGYPALKGSKYVRKDFEPELLRLGDELVAINPNIIIALGNTALWAVLGKTAISKLRGTTDLSTHTASGFKVLPTYHPAAVLRQWELRPTVVLDLMKAARESEFPELRRAKRKIWIEPTIQDLITFRDNYITNCPLLSVDIENPGGPIHEIGFSPDKHIGIVIPFLDKRKKNRSYWKTPQEEVAALYIVKGILEDIKIKKLFQNGIYDVSVIWRWWHVAVRGFEEDSMLIHHALQPEALKGLAFLGSLYGNEGPWKLERKFKAFKADD